MSLTSKKTLIAGATGYIGKRIAAQLATHGYEIEGTARSPEAEAALAAAGHKAVACDAIDIDRFVAVAKDHDVLVWAAAVPFEHEYDLLKAVINAYQGSDRTLLFLSGSGVVATDSPEGEWDVSAFAEDDPFPYPAMFTRQMRRPTEHLVEDAADRGLRTLIVRPPMVWGHGGSIQIPAIFESARRTGAACYFGKGLNLYSHSHVDDVAAVVRLALEKGTAGATYHTEAGEVNYRTIAEAVGEVMDRPARSLTYDEACEVWGEILVKMAFAVNSRTIARRTRSELGWLPAQTDLIEDIRHGSYRDAFAHTSESSGIWSGHQ
jgi:nucleoside-diphosphate-sugar epimerase